MLINFYGLSNFGLSCVLSRSVLVELDHICKSVSLRETACQENYSGKLKQTSTKAACLFSVGKVSKREFSFFFWTRSRFWTSEAAVIYILFTVLENNVVGHFSPFFFILKHWNTVFLFTPQTVDLVCFSVSLLNLIAGLIHVLFLARAVHWNPPRAAGRMWVCYLKPIRQTDGGNGADQKD